MNKRSPIKTPIVLALLAVYFIWGSTYLAIRMAIEGFPPFMMAGLRYSIAGSLLYLFLRSKGEPAPTRAQWRGATLIGGFLLLGGNGGVAFAEQWVPSGLAALVIATTPIWMVLFSGIWGRWPGRIEWTGLLLGLAGVALLNLDASLRANPLGFLALLAAALSWSFGSAWSRHLPLPSGLMASAAEMIAGGALLLLVSALGGEKAPAALEWRSTGALLYLVVFGSLVGFSSYVYLLTRVRPALATSYAYVNPVIAVFLGVMFAGERITLVGLTAMLIILAGVVLVIAGQRSAVKSAANIDLTHDVIQDR